MLHRPDETFKKHLARQVICTEPLRIPADTGPRRVIFHREITTIKLYGPGSGRPGRGYPFALQNADRPIDLFWTREADCEIWVHARRGSIVLHHVPFS